MSMAQTNWRNDPKCFRLSKAWQAGIPLHKLGNQTIDEGYLSCRGVFSRYKGEPTL